jgi:hypothetical protein
MAPSVLILGVEGDWGLMGSYGRAFAEIGADVSYWNFSASVAAHARFGKVGQRIAGYLPIEPWILKANRELITTVMERKPAVVAFTGADLRAGALAQLKVACPDTKLVLLWPDTLLNLGDPLLNCMRVVDLVGCYSQTAIAQLELLGAKQVIWTPFAMDCELFPEQVEISPSERLAFQSDVSFIGNHRPERERDILRLVDAGVKVKVWAAATWPRLAKHKGRVAEYFQGGPLFGKDVAKAMRCSTLALNLIDPLNYPAANMRVFETYACSATPLCSRCPEVESVFPDRESAFYFDDAQLPSTALTLLKQSELVKSVGERGRQTALAAHKYTHRAQALLRALGLN